MPAISGKIVGGVLAVQNGIGVQGPAGAGVAQTRDVAQTAHGLSVGNEIKVTGNNTYAKAKADSAANAEIAGRVTAVTDANNFTYLPIGQFITGSGYTAGVVRYLDPSTAGADTATKPNTVGQVVKPVLLPINTTEAIQLDYVGYVIASSTTVTEPEVLIIAASDEVTPITTGTAKATIRMPFAMTLTEVRASLTTASSSGIPTFDINENGTTILSTKLTIDASEKTSKTAATPPVISDTSLADDAEITIDIDVSGISATGAKVYLIGYRS